ncbi:hypothetical protein ABIB75_001110 [Bradyrhizobium sp. GM2.2]
MPFFARETTCLHLCVVMAIYYSLKFAPTWSMYWRSMQLVLPVCASR